MIAFSDRIVPERELKSDADSCVLLARDRKTSERCIYREFRGSGDVYRRLLELECPWLPRIEAVEERDGVTAVLEEYVQGDSLAFLLENGPLPQEQAEAVAVQLCRALETLHGLDIVHRDVKPENVLLRAGGAVLIDFDASRLRKEKHDTDTRAMGTAGYAAPEQYGFSQTDARADIFAMGVLLNEMLTGKHPATTLAPGWLGRIVQTCIEVNMDRRYASAQALREALEAGERTQKTKKTRRILLWTAAALVLVAAILLLVLRPWKAGTPRRLERLAVSGDVTDDTGIARMEFRYDLDGDGEEETYLFGVYMDLPGRLPGGVDSRVLTGDMEESVFAAPGVWRQDEAGNYEPVFAFAELLEDPETTLWRRNSRGEEEPDVWLSEPMDGVWKGAIEVLYSARSAGEWRYAVSASLNGEQLTAAATTTIERGATLATD